MNIMRNQILGIIILVVSLALIVLVLSNIYDFDFISTFPISGV